MFPKEEMERLLRVATGVNDQGRAILDAAQVLSDVGTRIETTGRTIIEAIRSFNGAPPAATPRQTSAVPSLAPHDGPATQSRPPGESDIRGERTTLSKAERSILTVLAQYGPGRTKRQVATLTGYAIKGGGFGNALGALRSRGLIEGISPLFITSDGLAAVDGQYEELPPPGQGLISHWLRQLPKAERHILAELARVYPDSLTKDEVAARTEYTVTGGGFNNALGRLRTLELIDGHKELRASAALFGG